MEGMGIITRCRSRIRLQLIIINLKQKIEDQELKLDKLISKKNLKTSPTCQNPKKTSNWITEIKASKERATEVILKKGKLFRNSEEHLILFSR